jgi:modulator of FtsH protease
MPSGWENFFIAEVDATAALAGLVIVAISINLSRILAFPELPGRAAEAIVVLAGALVLSSLTLIPQALRTLGLEVLIAAAVIWLVPVIVQVRTYRAARAGGKSRMRARALLAQINTLPFVVAGASIALGNESGFYWLSAGVILALIGGMLNTWVLLVEILR